MPPEAHYEHQKSNTITVQQGLMLSDSTKESKAGLLGKSGDSLWDILSEKGAGVMGGDGTAAGHNTVTGNNTTSEGRRTWSWQRWHFGAPQRTCACCGKHQEQIMGWKRTGSCRTRGLAHTGTFASLWLLTSHLLQRLCCADVDFAVW